MSLPNSRKKLIELYSELSQQACELQKEFDTLLEREIASEYLHDKQWQIVSIELKMREVRKLTLERYFKNIPFLKRWNTPKYWQICCPIKLDYESCRSAPWYEHITRRWYASEFGAIVSTYNFLIDSIDGKIDIRPLEEMALEIASQNKHKQTLNSFFSRTGPTENRLCRLTKKVETV
jgi:hypothetical protein